MAHSSVVIAAILLMGGKGDRFGSSTPKQLHRIGGKCVFIHTLERFLTIPSFSQIILVTPLAWIEEVQKQLKPFADLDKIHIIPGGETRQESSYRGLQACPAHTTHVVIHDAVRPFVSTEILENNVQAVLAYGAVDTCIPSTDTLVYAPTQTTITHIPIRSEFFRGQTPQSFSFPLIQEAHQNALAEGICQSSDDCFLVQRLGHPIHIVLGSEQNIKITTELDLFLAEQLLYRGQSPLSPNRLSLEKKIFAITGGTGSIGKAITQALVEKGAQVLPLSLHSTPFHANLTDPKQVQELFANIHQQHGPLDGLINSIGHLCTKPFASLTAEEIEHTIACNLKSIVYCCQYAQIKPGGHLTNISSSSYSRGRKEHPLYSATKAAVVNLTQALADLWPHLHVNVLVPPRIDSPLRQTHFPLEDKTSLLSPSAVGEKVSHLLSQTGITGTIIEVRKK